MSRTATKPTPTTINIAVPVETHQRFKREADARGMKLVHYPRFLAELVEVTTPEQQAAAFARFEKQRRRQPAGAGTT